MKNFTLSLLLSTVIASYSLADPVKQKPPEEIPIHLYKDYLVLAQGSIGPVDNVTLLIDTGATSTVISPFLAKKLNLQVVEKKAVAMGSRLRTGAVILQDIRIGNTRFRFVPAVVTDLSALGNVDAILGMNALVRTSLRIDYRSRTVRFRPEHPLSSSGEMTVQDLKPSITLKVGGKPVRLLLDSGARDLVLFGSRLDDRPRMHRSWQSKPIASLGGSDRAELVSLAQAQLGPTSWGQLEAYLLDTRIEHYRDLQGFVGPVSLGWNSVQFDFSNNQLSWE